MAKVSCDISEIIEYLIKKREEGYERVEVIDIHRASGWCSVNPTIEFVFNKEEPKVVGICAFK